MTEPVLKVQRVSKRYARDLRRAQRYGVSDILREVVPGRSGDRDLRDSEFWAVKDVSLELCPGEAVGIVGRNGAGKSTLLRMIAGITKPDDGSVVADRRVGSLLDPNAGFDPILTGRENLEAVYALWRGQRADQTVIDEVIAYAGLAGVAGTPVRTYSQGMRMRLGFSLMIHLDPDILLIDEALAVGDTAFQLRCLEQLRSYCRSGGALLFVSHSLWLFQHMAERGVHLAEGSIAVEGPPHKVSNSYLEELQSGSWVDSGGGPELLDRERVPVATEDHSTSLVRGTDQLSAALDRPVRITRVSLMAPTGGLACNDGPAVLELDLDAREDIPAAEAGFTLWTGDSSVCVLAGLSEKVSGGLTDGTFALAAGRTVVRFRTDALPLTAGRYLAKAAVYEMVTGGVVGMHGYEDVPTPFEVLHRDGSTVADGPADVSASQSRLPPLRTLRAEWSEQPAGGREGATPALPRSHHGPG